MLFFDPFDKKTEFEKTNGNIYKVTFQDTGLQDLRIIGSMTLRL